MNDINKVCFGKIMPACILKVLVRSIETLTLRGGYIRPSYTQTSGYKRILNRGFEVYLLCYEGLITNRISSVIRTIMTYRTYFKYQNLRSVRIIKFLLYKCLILL